MILGCLVVDDQVEAGHSVTVYKDLSKLPGVTSRMLIYRKHRYRKHLRGNFKPEVAELWCCRTLALSNVGQTVQY